MMHMEADDSESRRVLDQRDRENRWLEKQVDVADMDDKKNREDYKLTTTIDSIDGVNQPKWIR